MGRTAEGRPALPVERSHLGQGCRPTHLDQRLSNRVFPLSEADRTASR
jgi:hypothetical protein